jgi:hypothetical protein
MIKLQKLIRVSQARKIIGLPLSRSHINRLIRAGVIPAVRIGGLNYIDPDKLIDALVSDQAWKSCNRHSDIQEVTP